MNNLKEKIIIHGIEVFGSIEKFNKWLETPNVYFDYKPPLEFLENENGINFIEMKLTNIEYGDLA